MNSVADSFYLLAAKRRSIRQFSDDQIESDVLQRVLQAAIKAPSAHNRQPWRFVVLDRRDRREALVAAMTDRWRDDLARDGLAEDEILRLTLRNKERLLAPAILVVLFLTMEDMDQYPDEKRRLAEWMMAVQSVALAGGHILLAAQAENLGACWMCAPLFVPQLIRQTLDLPASWEAQGVIAIGHPAEKGRARPRMALEEVAIWR